MSQSSRTILLGILLGATAVLPFAAFGADPVLLVVIPAALAAGWLGWRSIRSVARHERDLEVWRAQRRLGRARCRQERCRNQAEVNALSAQWHIDTATAQVQRIAEER